MCSFNYSIEKLCIQTVLPNIICMLQYNFSNYSFLMMENVPIKSMYHNEHVNSFQFFNFINNSKMNSLEYT